MHLCASVHNSYWCFKDRQVSVKVIADQRRPRQSALLHVKDCDHSFAEPYVRNPSFKSCCPQDANCIQFCQVQSLIVYVVPASKSSIVFLPRHDLRVIDINGVLVLELQIQIQHTLKLIQMQVQPSSAIEAFTLQKQILQMPVLQRQFAIIRDSAVVVVASRPLRVTFTGSPDLCRS